MFIMTYHGLKCQNLKCYNLNFVDAEITKRKILAQIDFASA